MYLVRFKYDTQLFKKNGVYLFDKNNAAKVPKHLVDIVHYNHIEPYKNQSTLLLARSGGMGDIVAMSVLQDVAPKTVFITQDKFRPLLNLWQKPPKLVDFSKPFTTAKSVNDLMKQLPNYGRLHGEDAIELESPENWYDIFLKSAGKEPGTQRPQLKEYKLPTIEGCLIVWKASSVNRTAVFEDIANAVTHKFTNIVDVMDQGWNTKQYLDALASYEYVISVDTSALHIREGLGLPALGLYGAFDKDSRTSGYIYTTSIQSNVCSPCYARPKTICAKNNNTPYAPCLMNIGNQIQI